MKILLLTFQKGFIWVGCTSLMRIKKSAVKERTKFKTKMKFQDFCSSELKTYGVFNGVVVGFEPKGIPGRMCALKVRSYYQTMFLLMILNQIGRENHNTKLFV